MSNMNQERKKFQGIQNSKIRQKLVYMKILMSNMRHNILNINKFLPYIK